MATRSQVEKAIDSRLDAALDKGKAKRARGELAKSVAYDTRRRRLQVELVVSALRSPFRWRRWNAWPSRSRR